MILEGTQQATRGEKLIISIIQLQSLRPIQRCRNSHINVMEVTNNFSIRFKINSMLWNPYLIAIMTKNLILDSITLLQLFR